MAQLDVNRGVLEHERRVQIKEAVLGVIDDLADHVDASPAKDGEPDGDAPPRDSVPPPPGKTVLCVAGRGSLDEAAAAMLAQLLERQGMTARVVASDAVAVATILQLDVSDVELVFLSYLEPGGFTNARYLVRRLRRKLPGVPIVAGFWTLAEDDARYRDALSETGADRVVMSLREAAEHAPVATAGAERADLRVSA